MFDLKPQLMAKESDFKAELLDIKFEVEKEGQIEDKDKAIKEVKDSIENAFDKRAPKEKFAILMSGGVDSTLLSFLAKSKGLDFTCYLSVMEWPDGDIPHDEERAISACKEMDMPLKIKRTTMDELEKLLPLVIKTINKIDPVSVSVVATLWQSIAHAKADGINIFMTGAGAEQIYGGGQRYREVEDINELGWDRLMEHTYQSDVWRYKCETKHFDMKVLVPFFDRDVVKTAMRIPGSLKNTEKHQKYIMRLAAESLGLPKEFAWRRIRPAQYGSKFDRAIEKLGKKNGFKYKKEYLESI